MSKTKTPYLTHEHSDSVLALGKYCDPKLMRQNSSSRNVNVITSTLTQSLDMMQSFNSTKGAGLDVCHNRYNNDKVGKFISSDDTYHTQFAGGTYEDLLDKPDTTNFKVALSKLRKSKKFRKLEAALGEKSLRKRRFNEHDGEYDHDKKWDITPFAKAEKMPVPAKILTINGHMAFNAGVSSKKIDKYGAVLAAVCNLLESNGIMVEINACKASVNTSYDSILKNDVLLTVVKVKKVNDYLPLQSLVRTFTSNYLRRVLFVHTVMNADMQGAEIDSGLGQPMRWNEMISSSAGRLDIYSAGVIEDDNVEQFIDELMKALGAE